MANSTQLSTGLETIFGSAPTAAQLAFYQNICDTQGIDAAYRSAVDADAADTVRTVISFYQVFYGRQPDQAGLEYWTDQIDSGRLDLNAVATEFATASEYNERYGGRTPTEVVIAQYRNVLDRAPDFEGLTYWTEQVSSGNLTIADLGRYFATADETQERFDPFLDAFLINAANGVQTYDQNQSLFDETLGNATGAPTPGGPAPIDLAGQTGPVTGGTANDTFTAETGDLTSRSNVDGGAGADTLTVFNDGVSATAISPRMQNVETVVWTEQTNDGQSRADNNVGGYNNDNNFFFDGTTMVDVELDAGRINGVRRWEDFDSRADLVIEDIRDRDDVDGTFTGDLTVAMVSTDPGNVDYATYFDQPVNTSTTNDSIFIQVIDQNNSKAFSATDVTNLQTGSLEDARLDDFSFILNGERVDVALDRTDPDIGTAFFGANATYTDLLNAINAALDNATLADGTPVNTLVSASFGGVFVENIGNDNTGAATNTQVFGRQIVINSQPGSTLADAGIGNDFTVTQLGEPADIAASVRAQTLRNDELIRLNVELDDVGKGSMGGDLLAGAMSTGRQNRDDGTSDSQGIQQFDIEVDRSSQLQTINSTNNALEVVTLTNGENDGPNNTTTAADEQAGDLVVRGRANPATDTSGDPTVATDNPMPGAFPQHNAFGFSDVRAIDASTMVGNVDLTAELTNEIVEKYLDNADTLGGNVDDRTFTYNLSNGVTGAENDEFLLNMSSSALIDAGTGSREDFNLVINGNNGNDSIVTNVGGAQKLIDGQGQDYYNLIESGAWYANQANNDAATIQVTGGAGNDTIWTKGWGDAVISGGFGADTVYTDNSGTVTSGTGGLNNAGFGELFGNLTRNIGEHQQIDYEVGAVWTFNDDNGDDDESATDPGNTFDAFGNIIAFGDGGVTDISGSTNNGVALASGARVAGTVYNTTVAVSFFGATGSANANTEYVSTATVVPASISTAGVVTNQGINQAIKNAINTDPVLNKVLEAVDGPGQSLAVYSKIDGAFVSNDLQIDLYETLNGGAPVITALNTTNGAAYDTSGGSAFSDFQNFGRASTAESDNIISIRADSAADVTVLSTNDTANGNISNASAVSGDLNGASNELLRVEEGNFGVETIFNFGVQTGTDEGGEDRFEFLAIDYNNGTSGFTNNTANTVNQGDDSISIIAETTGNDTAAEVGGLFTNNNTTALEHIVIVYNDTSSAFDTVDNTGKVYLVTNGAGVGATAVLQGEIDLIGTEWSSLESDNFF